MKNQINHYKKIAFFIVHLLVLLPLFMSVKTNAEGLPDSTGHPVNDFADVIPPAYEQQINAIAIELFNKTETAVVVATMSDIGGEDYNDYANRLFEKWGIGQKGVDKGVLIFVTVKERKMRIETGYGVEGILPDGLVGEIRDKYMIPYLKQDRYGEGILNGTAAVAQVVSKAAGAQLTGQIPVKQPKKTSRSIFSFFPILIIIFFFILGSKRRGSWIFFLPFLMGGGGSRHSSGGFGGSFGGFSGGFGGFGGGMSGGGGAGGSF
ncbi:MAG: TPM domain-containing protein [Deltaproteobacteria bacterium]|nr:TPM domain-containing protein [Deltaproteobacteria bacterium]